MSAAAGRASDRPAARWVLALPGSPNGLRVNAEWARAANNGSLETQCRSGNAADGSPT